MDVGYEDTSRGQRQRALEDELVRDHLALVHYAVNELAARVPKHVRREDLVSAGMAGLAHAARNFEADRGIRFNRYALTRIRGALLDELRSGDWASRSVRRHARKVQDATDALTMALGRAPTKDEVAEKLGWSGHELDAVTDDVQRAAVLNYDSFFAEGSGEDVLPADRRTPDSILLERERQAYMVDAVAALPERLRQVVVGYFFQEQSMQELADQLGVTDSRISQMRAEALELLRDGINAHLDPDNVQPARHEGPRVARRKAAYFGAIGARSSCSTRITGEMSLADLAV